MKVIETNLTGSQIIERIQQGHIVRRACWVDGFYIRLCNESGYDEQGKAIFDDKKDMLYTLATNGYFMHLGYSSQPFNFMHHSRDAQGIGMLFASDWEDYGFISREDFDKLEKKTEEKVRKLERSFIIAIDY